MERKKQKQMEKAERAIMRQHSKKTTSECGSERPSDCRELDDSVNMTDLEHSSPSETSNSCSRPNSAMGQPLQQQCTSVPLPMTALPSKDGIKVTLGKCDSTSDFRSPFSIECLLSSRPKGVADGRTAPMGLFPNPFTAGFPSPFAAALGPLGWNSLPGGYRMLQPMGFLVDNLVQSVNAAAVAAAAAAAHSPLNNIHNNNNNNNLSPKELLSEDRKSLSVEALRKKAEEHKEALSRDNNDACASPLSPLSTKSMESAT